MGATGLAAYQKKASRLKAHLVFADETGFFMSPLVRRTWAAAGCTPILHTRTRSHRRVSAIGAISISPRRRRLGLLLRLHPGESIAQDQVLAFLKDLLRHVRGHVVLIWDRLPAHRGKRIQQYVASHPRLHVEWLPGYAPELNATEYLWGWMKTNPLANRCALELDELTDDVADASDNLGSQQQLLRGFVHATKLPIRFQYQHRH